MICRISQDNSQDLVKSKIVKFFIKILRRGEDKHLNELMKILRAKMGDSVVGLFIFFKRLTIE